MPRGARGLSIEQLKEMARRGAEDALKRLRAEIIAIERTFPELALPKHRRAVRKAFKAAAPRGQNDVGGGSQGSVGTDEEVWAERRKAKAKVK